MVFLINDISDVPVDLSKLANFMKWKITTIACFVIMIIVWAITRLGLLPFVVCRSMVFESHNVVPAGIDVLYYYMVRPFLYGVTFGTVFLHVFLFYMFLKIGYKRCACKIDVIESSFTHFDTLQWTDEEWLDEP